MCDDIKYRHPFPFIVRGPSGSGNSSFCIRFLEKLDAICTERKIGEWIVWCYGEKSAVPSLQQQQLSANICFSEGVTDDLCNAHGQLFLLILDDLLNDVYSNQVCDLFTRGSHH